MLELAGSWTLVLAAGGCGSLGAGAVADGRLERPLPLPMLLVPLALIPFVDRLPRPVVRLLMPLPKLLVPAAGGEAVGNVDAMDQPLPTADVVG